MTLAFRGHRPSPKIGAGLRPTIKNVGRSRSDALAQSIQDVCEDHCRAIEEQEKQAKAKFDNNFSGL